jgi:hypothetical protein
MTDHIKMPDVAPVIRYLGNGSQTEFEYPFPIFASEDMLVHLGGAPQAAGFTIEGAGESSGGRVTFDTAPPAGVIVTLQRRMKLERLTDFIEGGDFSAQAINTELDSLTAGLQQLERDQSPMLRYHEHETPGVTNLPDRTHRAGKALGFDGDGNPVAVSLEGSMAPPDFTAIGIGAATRTSHDKFSDMVSIKDFGAIGDGLTDDTLAIQRALAAHDSVFVPSGIYLITQPLELGSHQTLVGAGQTATIKANAMVNILEIGASYVTVQNLRLESGNIGIKLYGKNGPCVNNAISDVTTWQAQTGILLDGGSDTNKPTYWNNFDRVLVAQPFVNGIHLLRTGAGDTPNANRFHQCRVYSLGATTSGHGLYVEEGSFNNSFIDFEANVHPTALACVRVGYGSNKTLFVNLYTESTNEVPNIQLDAGSIETAIYNLLSASNGAAIYDLSGGQYTAYNAGFPHKNRLQRTFATDMTSKVKRYETEYIDASGTIALDISHSVHLVSSFGGALTVTLPNAGEAVGVMMMIKKIDSSKNVITIQEDSGNGPDGSDAYLGSENDYIQLMSNGAEWFVIASSRAAGNTRFYDGSGIYDIDMAVDTYFLSSFGGALTARLPPANAAKAIGRTVTIKKTDTSSNVITVSVQGGPGPDQYNQPLSSQYDAITVVSDGGQWFIVSRFP